MFDVKITIHTNPEAILDTFRDLPDDAKQTILTAFTFDEILARIEQQLRHETDWHSWNTNGWVDSSRLRAALIKIQGIEPEYKKDLESRIRSLEHDVAHYKKYYDWYFKLWRAAGSDDWDRERHLCNWINKIAGWL